MQIVDYWVGVPLCALLSVVHWTLGLFRKPKKATPQKMLFIELSEMGSAILAYSALVRAKQLAIKNGAGKNGTEQTDEGAPYFLIFAKNRESCDILDVLPRSHVLVIDDRSFLRFAFSALRALIKVRALAFDTVIDLELFSRFTALFTYLSGAPNRVGFHNHTNEGLFRGNFLTHAVTYNAHQHMALNFLALVSALESPLGEQPLVKRDVRGLLKELPELQRTPQEYQAMWEILRKHNAQVSPSSTLLVFNPDPGDAIPIRGWPETRFTEVAASLLDSYPDAFIVVIGLSRSRPFAERMMSSLGSERVIDLTGATKTLYEVVTLFGISKLLVTNDSGPAHVASLARLPRVVLFGPETPALYGPLGAECMNLYAHLSCSPCLTAANHRYTTCSDNRCLQAISVHEVISVSKQLLREAGVVENAGLLNVVHA